MGLPCGRSILRADGGWADRIRFSLLGIPVREPPIQRLH